MLGPFDQDENWSYCTNLPKKESLAMIENFIARGSITSLSKRCTLYKVQSHSFQLRCRGQKINHTLINPFPKNNNNLGREKKQYNKSNMLAEFTNTLWFVIQLFTWEKTSRGLTPFPVLWVKWFHSVIHIFHINQDWKFSFCCSNTLSSKSQSSRQMSNYQKGKKCKYIYLRDGSELTGLL